MGDSSAPRTIVCESALIDVLRNVEERRRKLIRRAWRLTFTQPVLSLLWLGLTICSFMFDGLIGFIVLFGGGGLCVAIFARADRRLSARDSDSEKLEELRGLLLALQDVCAEDEPIWIEAELFPASREHSVDKEDMLYSYEHRWLSARFPLADARGLELFLTRCIDRPKGAANAQVITTRLRLVLRAGKAPLLASTIVCPDGWSLTDQDSSESTLCFEFLGEGEPTADNLIAAVRTTLDTQERSSARL